MTSLLQTTDSATPE